MSAGLTEEHFMEPSINDRVKGVLRGISAGDRIGGPIRMALHVADSLVAERGFTRADILRRYVAWWETEGFDAGRVAALVFDAINEREQEVMAVYRPTYTDPKTGLQKESRVWWYEFTNSGKRIRESAKTTRKTLASEAESGGGLNLNA